MNLISLNARKGRCARLWNLWTGRRHCACGFFCRQFYSVSIICTVLMCLPRPCRMTPISIAASQIATRQRQQRQTPATSFTTRAAAISGRSPVQAWTREEHNIVCLSPTRPGSPCRHASTSSPKQRTRDPLGGVDHSDYSPRRIRFRHICDH